MDACEWLVLIASIRGNNSNPRVRLWRQMKALGAASLVDGAYLLPALPTLQQHLGNLQEELIAAGGNAYLLRVREDDPIQLRQWRDLFDRNEAYSQWTLAQTGLLAALPDSESDARRSLRQLRKELEAIAATDYFPGEPLTQARRQCNDAERQLTRHYSPDEPLSVDGEIARLDRAAYQGRIWATRARPWVDRVASAWLIQRFIDPTACFLWLADSRNCPPDALGFDFDDATFTHVGERVTFETLLASFGLEQDGGLLRLGAMVHALDVGGVIVPEAAGFEAMLGGTRQRLADDDQLLAEISQVLDSLYAHFTPTHSRLAISGVES
ncbi:chromate resistance protein ChrB domain-containing protein [Chromobacterium vaccinii]|uniref:Chromate resistance protein n=1 Tax=Chromobacterium vaccinii TaxID=1108595 RepID=A0A1D9LGL3_9NEIS|nr:chromate resistance protein ChrB domain-containing protein [Chromobacterium vaccinii]AOZ50406.1 hypothetical protein BKX93_10650 [Chromobacterium vaccinii]